MVRYEDLLTEPEAHFGRVTRFLRLEFTSKMLQKAIENSSFPQLNAQESAQNFREKPEKAPRFFHSGQAGQWQNTLSPQQIEAILHTPMMMRFNYINEAGKINTK